MALLGGDSTLKLVTLLLASSFVHQYVSARRRDMRHLAVEVTAGPEEATRIAEQYGLINLGQVGELEGFYNFAIQLGRKSSMLQQLKHLRNDNHVGMVEIQRVRHHHKRAYTQPLDPLWNQQWQLLNREQLVLNTTERLDLNIERVWMQGITGTGVTVAIVDDGVEHSHPDLSNNYDPHSSYDIIDDDNDPTPSNFLPYTNEHGTSCAGIVVMARNNGKCGVGVAYNSKLAGIRMLSYFGATDIQEATAFNHKYNRIDIYSNSWGPPDTGYAVQGPGQLASRAFEMGIKEGRFGKGSLYVWAAGNGGKNGDSCATDGYASSIYTIAVGSADFNGAPASYDEKCSSKLAVVYNQGNTSLSQTVTTGTEKTCTSSFTGTSAAAPLLAGTLALALQANPTLTWRDVQYLLVYTSDSSKLVHSTEEWRQNGAGLWFNHQHGFGAVNAEALVTRARHWSTVPDQIRHDILLNHTDRNVTRLQPLTLNFTFPENSDVAVLEHVEVIATLSIEKQDRIYGPNELYHAGQEDYESIIFHTSARRGDIEINLTSPHQTKSTILPHRERDFVNSVGFSQWPFMSVHFWGENPTGEWSLSIGFKSETGCVWFKNASVIYYGTRTKPNSVSKTCSKECAENSGCASSSPADCDACNSYRDPVSLACLPKCPNSTIAHNGYCINQKKHFSYHYHTSIKPTSSSSMKTSFHSRPNATTIVSSTETMIQPVVPTVTPSRGYGGTVGGQQPPLTDSLAPSSSARESRALSLYIILLNSIAMVLLFLY